MFARGVHVQSVFAPGGKSTTRCGINRRDLSTAFRRNHRAMSNMATPSRIHVEASLQPRYHVKGLTAASAETTSRLLQLNHEGHHIFFNRSGFHNHIAHHLLTLFALAASPSEIQAGYDTNVSYQRPPEPLKESIVRDMHDPARFETYLGKEQYYHDFLVFFQAEMETKGQHAVLEEYLFAADTRANDMLSRLYAGFLHPLIHLGFGVEFLQPAIVAEALAQAAVHGSWMGGFFLGCEKAVEAKKGEKTIMQLLEDAKGNEKLRTAASWNDGNKIRDGILKRAPEEMMALASQYRIGEDDDLEEKTAEMINAAVYFTAAAQHPPYAVKFDFFLMHCLNSSLFFPAFLSAFPRTTARRLLEWKVRNDMAMYVSRGCPTLLPDEITTYIPPCAAGWDDVIQRVIKFDDDGHASKLIRALAHGGAACQPYEGRAGFPVSGDMWLQIAHMAIDSVEAGAPHWVRSCGFEQAWADVPVRGDAKL